MPWKETSVMDERIKFVGRPLTYNEFTPSPSAMWAAGWVPLLFVAGRMPAPHVTPQERGATALSLLRRRRGSSILRP